MHENLKVVLNTSIRNRYVVGFKTKEDVGQILALLGTDDYEGILYEEYQRFSFLERLLVLIIQYYNLIKFPSCLTHANYL